MKCRSNRPLALRCGVLLLYAFTAAVNASEVTRTNVAVSTDWTLAASEIETMLRDNIDLDKEAIGLVVGIADEHGSRVVTYGKFDDGSNREVGGDTLFEIGSVTKVFTALLLQQMVEGGEMKLDDPVARYLPSSVRMPTYEGKEITLLHLATHTSGLPRDDSGDLYSFLSHCTLRQAPGTGRNTPTSEWDCWVTAFL